ncbi:flavin reductase family protein [Cellulomonas sp.]|uniref:flavin reductase family protein n=1 Tax=Cellulomonas sp. TaxID=40001 RepID=UPI002D32F5AF|nr:flavin reductase family protein [Cellulomonas sp.]HYQ74525.1 flavin reductase family protein [Cellulomonas sp.]
MTGAEVDPLYGDGDAAGAAAGTDAFRAAMGRLPAGVVVVAVRWKGTDHAMTASALTSVSLEPPMLLLCVHQDARLRDALDDVDTWAVSVLADDQAPVADWLASPGRPAVGQLDRVPHVAAPRSGAAWVSGAAAWFECRTSRIVPAGDHDVVLADVLESREGDPAAGSLVHLRRRVRGLR